MKEAYKYNEDGDVDFYESFEMALEDDEITSEEERFMIGFVEIGESGNDGGFRM